MAGTPDEECNSQRSARPETLAETLFYIADPARRKELEEFRIKYEAAYGPTDLTRRYTSTWPKPDQDWLLTHEPKRWFDGLPGFVKAFVRGKMQLAAGDGRLDDMPDSFVRLYVSRELKLDGEVRSR
jgi:hypothetical protein